jgi:hypothetical protein
VNIGDAVSGEYYGSQFSGVVTNLEPDWTLGARGTIHVYVRLDAPIAVQVGKHTVERDSLALLSVSAATGTGRWGCVRRSEAAS